MDTSISNSIRPSKSFPENPILSRHNPPMAGFSTSSGKPIQLSEKAKAYLKAKQEELIKDEPVVPAAIDPMASKDPTEALSKPVGFSTSSGKAIQLSEKAKEYLQAKQRELFSMPLTETPASEEVAPKPVIPTVPRIQGKKFTPPLLKPPVKSATPKFYIVKPMFELTRSEVK